MRRVVVADLAQSGMVDPYICGLLWIGGSLLAASRPVPSKYIWWLAWRNFSARRQGSGLSFMTVVSVVGIMIGVAALVIVLSVMGGFEADLRRKMLAGEPQLEILAENAVAGFSLKEHPVESFRSKLGLKGPMEPFVSADVVVKRRGFVNSATLVGIRPEMEGSKLWAFDGALIEGTLADLNGVQKPKLPQDRKVIRELPGIILGDQLALQIGADVGDEISVLSPQASASAALAGGTLARSYVVVGKVSSGIFTYDSKWAITNLEQARYFLPEYDASLSEEEYVTGVAANVPDPLDMTPYVKKVESIPGIKARTWQMANKSLLVALKLEKFTMGAILMLIVLVAAFSISGTMMMTVFFKKAQVSILRSLGMSRRDIVKLFLNHGFVIGTAGVALGLVIGMLVCWFIKSTQFIPLPQGIYYLRTLPVKYLPFEYGVICVCAWLFSLAASLYPAIAASRQNPSDGVRYE